MYIYIFICLYILGGWFDMIQADSYPRSRTQQSSSSSASVGKFLLFIGQLCPLNICIYMYICVCAC